MGTLIWRTIHKSRQSRLGRLIYVLSLTFIISNPREIKVSAMPCNLLSSYFLLVFTLSFFTFLDRMVICDNCSPETKIIMKHILACVGFNYQKLLRLDKQQFDCFLISTANSHQWTHHLKYEWTRHLFNYKTNELKWVNRKCKIVQKKASVTYFLKHKASVNWNIRLGLLITKHLRQWIDIILKKMSN